MMHGLARLLLHQEVTVTDLPALVLYPVSSEDKSVAFDIVRRLTSQKTSSPEALAPLLSPPQQQQQPLHTYTPDGSLFIDLLRSSQAAKAGVLELVKSVASTRHVSMTRRIIVLWGAGALVRHQQHALRKLMEASVGTSLFVLAVERVNELDAPLLSRSVIVNCVHHRGETDGTQAGTKILTSSTKLVNKDLSRQTHAQIVNLARAAAKDRLSVASLSRTLLSQLHEEEENEEKEDRVRGFVRTMAAADAIAARLNVRDLSACSPEVRDALVFHALHSSFIRAPAEKNWTRLAHREG